MTIHRQKKILAELTPDDFVGRTRELDALLAHAHSASAGGMQVLSLPGIGASEFLRQIYDRLFAEHSAIIPFYFEFSRSDRTAAKAAQRFAREFLAQAVAYRRDDSSLIKSPLEVSELIELALPSDGTWIRQIADLCGNEPPSVRACVSGPSRAFASGARVFVIIDALEETLFLENGGYLLNELEEAFSKSEMGFAFASRRRFVSPKRRRKSVTLEPLSLAESGELAESLSARLGVAINDQTRDLLAVQFQGNPSRISSIFGAASEKNIDLNSFRQISTVYAEELLSGRVGAKFDSVLDTATADSAVRGRVIEFLRDAVIGAPKKTPVDVWKKLLDVPEDGFGRMIDILNVEEVINVTSNTIETNSDDLVYSDCIGTRFMLEIEARPKAAVKADLVTESLKRAPRLMARLYRRSSSLGLHHVLSQFDCQDVPAALFDFGKFRDAYKGRDHKDIVTGLTEDKIRLTLPQIVFVEAASSFYPRIATLIEDERAAVGTGFTESKYTDDDQTAWLVAEIDSKLEAGPEIVNEWCDRLELVAANSNLKRRQIWLITPEGFTPEALDVLRQREAFGSSRQQAILLNRFLDPSQNLEEPARSDEYEIVVPMGEDTELIAAHAVEEVARRHHFPQKAINQIKTALVEACINAVEHSLSPDRKIYQKFAVDNEKINITVSNRGLRLADIPGLEVTPSGGRRGWGLSLMKGLMDEVRIEQVDDGTRIRMTKFLKGREN